MRLRIAFAAAAAASLALAATGPTASGQGAGDTGPRTSSGYLSVGGPKRLEPRVRLRIPIRCSVICDARITSKITLPEDRLGPQTSTAQLSPTTPRDLVLRLDRRGVAALKKDYAQARLTVRVAATAADTKEPAFAARAFRFKRP